MRKWPGIYVSRSVASRTVYPKARPRARQMPRLAGLGCSNWSEAVLLVPHDALAAVDCVPGSAETIGAAVNAHDISSFPEIFAECYIQYSGLSPSGLAAQIENFRQVFAATPDHRWRVEDRIIAGDKVIARSTHSATHTQTFRGIPPTGKPFSYTAIDIWRVENGKFAEHWDLTDAAEVLRRLRGE
jgi:predicted ester cyclase